MRALVACLLLLFAATAAAQAPVSVGMEGRWVLRHPGSEALRAKPVDEKKSLAVRIAAQRPAGKELEYDIRYIGIRPGKHDITRYLERVDGQPLQLTAHLVEITSLLPAGHQGDLHDADESSLPSFGGYRFWLIVGGILWLIPLVVWFVRAVLLTPPATDDASEGPPTLADQLRPLVEAAVAGTLDVHAKARLERMLLAHWRERLQIQKLEPKTAIDRLREHDEAGALLRELEGWLHQRPGTVTTDVERVLLPYRQTAAVTIA